MRKTNIQFGKLTFRLNLVPWYLIPLFVGIVFRLIGLGSSALWYDEAFSLFVTRQGLFQMIQNLQINLSPPGWEILLWFLTRILGWNEISSRLLSFLAGSVSLILVYRLAVVCRFNRTQTISALTGVALMPYLLWMSQEGKVYALFSCLFLLGILWAIQGRWLGLCAVMGLMLWSHYIALLYIPALIVLSLITHPYSWRKISITVLLAGVSWTPWLIVFLNKLSLLNNLTDSGSNWYGSFFNELGGSLIMSLFGSTPQIGFGVFLLLLLVITTIAWTALHSLLTWAISFLYADNVQRKEFWHLFWQKHVHSTIHEKRFPVVNNYQALLSIPVIVPLALFYLAAISKTNVLIYRTASIMVIPLIIWVSSVIALHPVRYSFRLFNRLFLVAWVVALVSMVSLWHPEAKGGNIKEVTKMIIDDWQTGDVIYYSSGTAALVLWQFMPEKTQYLTMGSNVFAEDLHIIGADIEQVPFTQIANKNAWLIWDNAPLLRALNPSVFASFNEIVQGCQLESEIIYPHLNPIDVYYCIGNQRSSPGFDKVIPITTMDS